MKKIPLILGLVLAFWAAPALAQQNEGSGVPQAGIQQGQGGGHQGGGHHGPRRREHGSTVQVPEDGDEIATTEATPYSNSDFAPWDNHLNVDAPVMSVE